VIEAFADVPAPSGTAPTELQRLTGRERASFDLLVRGQTNAEIARALHVEPSTVKTHVAHALTKLGLRDRVAAVIYAYEQGLLQRGDA
jgi:DNA-binding NarL/FixJ family response regulator